MSQRAQLINALVARGFKEDLKEGQITTGWTYKHEDGFVVWFNVQGRYRTELPGGKTQVGIAYQPSDILDRIDAEAAAL